MTKRTPEAMPGLPAEEELMKILSDPMAPPRITLDLTNSDGDLDGVVQAELDRHGNLVITRVG